ncbi:MAG TPA: dienelactone hydrolase family protein [Candidatus Acidoferrales bacterium]|nr:dienelactone hydrolase family protein [Candidatus Acidoferrales bacterium]
MKITSRHLSVEADGIPGFIAWPARARRGPGLLIIHHHFGVTGHIKATACDFAELGYATFAPNLYTLLGFPDYRGVQEKTTDGQFLEVIDSAWRYLLARPEVDPARAGAVGYCMGGRLGIHFAAATPSMRAFVGYYPSVRDEPPSRLRPRHPNDAAREIRCPSLIFFGAQDHVATIPVQDKLRASFLQNGQPLDWHFFHRAGHGFALADGTDYLPDLARLAWSLTSNFLAHALENEP